MCALDSVERHCLFTAQYRGHCVWTAQCRREICVILHSLERHCAFPRQSSVALCVCCTV